MMRGCSEKTGAGPGRRAARLGWLVGLAAAALLLPLARPSRGAAPLAAEEFRLLPLRMHLIRAKNAPDLNCKLQESDARRILGKINNVWRPAGIQFYADAILSEEAAAQDLYQTLGLNRTERHLRLIRPKESQSERAVHLYYVATMRPNGICLQSSHELLFVKESARLNEVPGGIDEPLPRVSSHEIGHALGLPHREERLNLMASGTTGTSLNDQEIEVARHTADGWSWVLKPAEALALAEKQAADGKPEAAAALYTALAALPDGEIAKTARDRVK